MNPAIQPPAGIFTGNNGAISLIDAEGNEFELLKVNNAVLRVNNNIGTYPQTGVQTITTYSQLVEVAGSISRAHINMAEVRLVIGNKKSISEDLKSLLTLLTIHSGEKQTGGILDFSRYPIKNLSVAIDVNDQIISSVSVPLDKAMRFTAYNVLFDSTQISFDARDLIRSGPLTYISSHASYGLIPPAPTQEV